jgi:hypothetical protein
MRIFTRMKFLLIFPFVGLFAQYDPNLHEQESDRGGLPNYKRSYNYSSPARFESRSMLPESSSSQNYNSSESTPVFEVPQSQRRRNAFSYYLGFSQPIDYGLNHLSTGNRFDLDHDHGILMEFEYRRYISDFHIGISNIYQSYKHHQLSNVPGLGTLDVSGYNGVFALMLNTGWSPYLTSNLFFESRLSFGVAYNIDELTVLGSTLKDEYTEVIYSAQVGLGYKFDNSITVSVIWKLLGQSDSERFDNALFHSAGLRLGYDY